MGRYIYGGDGGTGSAIKNKVTIANGAIEGVYGGSAANQADDNIVDISYGKFRGNIYGGESSTTKNNIVNIKGGTIEGNIYGGTSKNETQENKVNITKSDDEKKKADIFGTIYGGFSENSTAILNEVIISSDGKIDGGLNDGIYICAGYGYKQSKNNKITIQDGNITAINIWWLKFYRKF